MYHALLKFSVMIMKKNNMTTTLVIIVFQVWGIWEIRWQLFPIVKKNGKKNVKQTLSLRIFSWNSFLSFVSSKSKKFILLVNNYRDCKNSEPEGCCEAQVCLWWFFPCTFSLYWAPFVLCSSAGHQPNSSCLVAAATLALSLKRF